MLRTALVLGLLESCACSKMVLSTGNLAAPENYKTMPGPGLILGGIKATFDKVVKLKDQDIKLSALYEATDYTDLHDPANLKEVAFSGSYTLPERIAKTPRWTSHSDKDPFKVVYSVAHKFSSGVTAIKAAVITYGGKIKAKADTSGHAGLESISYGYAIKAAKTEWTVDNEFEFHGKYGADSVWKFNFGFFGVDIGLAQPFSPVMPDIELATCHELLPGCPGRWISTSVTVYPDVYGPNGVSSDAKMTYIDKKLEKGATWEMTFGQPLTKKRGAKLAIKRTWSFF